MPGIAPTASLPLAAPEPRLSWRVVTSGCLALAALSLLVLRQPAYDPTAWLIWGRALGSGSLDMVGGPSWKPLPVAFTFLFTRVGDDAAPLLWLLVARTAGFAALAQAFVLARRLGDARAGIVAALALGLATNFLYNCLRGDSEGLLVVCVLGAVNLHLSGRRHAALAVGLLAGLLRPEVWVLLAVYGVWLVRSDRRLRTLALTGGGGVALLALWFGPDYLVTGDLLRGAGRARHPVPGSPAQSAFPFGLTFVKAATFLSWPVFAGAAFAVRQALRGPSRSTTDRAVLILSAAAGVTMLVVALLSEVGFTGNMRYITLPGALLCIVGGVGLIGLVERVRGAGRPRLAGAALAVAVLGVATSLAIVAAGAVRLARDERALGGQLDVLIAAAGGEAGVRACGRVATTPFERQALAWRLHLPPRDVWTHGVAPGTFFVREGESAPGAAALAVRARRPNWTLRSSCPLG